MKSPFADCEARLVREPASITFRGEEFAYIYSFYECEQTKERFTTTELDEVNTRQIYNQYRERYGIPFDDEIAALKDRYGVSASRLALILGFGENQISNYIDGEVPSKTNGKVLGAIMDVNVFETYVDRAANQLGEKHYTKLKRRIQEIKEHTDDESEKVIYEKRERSIYNGYASQDAQKLYDTIMLSLSAMGDTFMTKMNKILFYIDMLAYRKRGIAITGLAYKAEQFGTIPFRSNKVYAMLNIPQTTYYEGGKEFSPFHTDGPVTTSHLSEPERDIILAVCDQFKGYTSKEISDLNHTEPAWKKYKFSGRPIPFSEAFLLTQIRD